MAKKEIDLIIKRYLQTLKDNGINVSQIILYGSYARNKAKQDSDIDLAVISPDFGRDYIGEAVKLKLLTIDVDPDISPRPYSVTELEQSGEGTFLYDEIVSRGIVYLA